MSRQLPKRKIAPQLVLGFGLGLALGLRLGGNFSRGNCPRTLSYSSIIFWRNHFKQKQIKPWHCSIKMEFFMTIVNSWKLWTIVARTFTLQGTGILDLLWLLTEQVHALHQQCSQCSINYSQNIFFKNQLWQSLTKIITISNIC